MSTFRQIHAQTIEVYEAEATAWDNHRSRSLIERPWLEKLISTIVPNSHILDVGCGSGDPISRFFIERGFHLTGIDAAKAMIEIAQARFPAMNWHQMDMRQLSLNQQFDGIIAWDSFFHLNQEEQRFTLKCFLDHLKPDGAILLTVGHEAGQVLGTVEGRKVYHSSLSLTEYTDILSRAGLLAVEFVAKDKECGLRSVILAHS